MKYTLNIFYWIQKIYVNEYTSDIILNVFMVYISVLLNEFLIYETEGEGDLD